MNWLPEEESFLNALKQTSFELSRDYALLHEKLKKIYSRFRIPQIVIGSISGTASFGTGTFPKSGQNLVSIVVGCLNIALACSAAIETFLGLGNRMSSSLQSSNDLRKLFQDIELELSLPIIDRQTSGIAFVRDIYQRFQEVLKLSPNLPTKKLHQDRLKLMSDRLSSSSDREQPFLEKSVIV